MATPTAVVPDVRIVPNDNNQLFADRSTTTADQAGFVLDNTWAKIAFLANDADLADSNDIQNRYWSSADMKFTDTTLGGNIGINSRPQFCRYADIRRPGRLSGRNQVSINNVGGNYGMGRYYSEALDDNAQKIYLRFGVPQFNSITAFLSKAFNSELSGLVKTGRVSDAYKAGFDATKTIGKILNISFFPVLAATTISKALTNTFFDKPRSKFYRLKPTSHIYWSAVDMMLNTILINSGVIPRTVQSVTGSNNNQQGINTTYQVDNQTMSDLNNMLPDIFTSQYGIDTFAAANKAQRVANKLFQSDYDALNSGSAYNYLGFVQKNYQTKLEKVPGMGFLAFLNKVVMTSSYFTSPANGNNTEVDPTYDANTGTPIGNKDKANVSEFFDAETREGSQFSIFVVDATGPVNESFSNSAIESDLSNKLNSVSSQVRETQFNFAEGNLSENQLVNMAQQAVGTVKDFVTGALDATPFGGISILAGNGFVDIPKHWQSSNVNLPRSTYSMELISPYGNIISRIQNIYMPLCMLLAGALPRSVGNQSYTGPFLVQLFDRGRCQVQMGMIESLNINRGSSNLGFNNKGAPLSINVSFSIVDMSTIMHMPISTGELYTSGPDKVLDEDNILMDYLAVLAGQDLYSQIYSVPKAKLSMSKQFHELERMTSPAYLASAFNETTTTGILSGGLFGNVTKLYSTLSTGSSVIPR